MKKHDISCIIVCYDMYPQGLDSKSVTVNLGFSLILIKKVKFKCKRELRRSMADTQERKKLSLECAGCGCFFTTISR